MYEHMLDRDLSELFMEYYKLDWKKRSEAAKILGYIKDPDEINKLTPYIIELAQDNNKITKINLMNSIKKIILEYEVVNEDLFVLLCCWANSSNNAVSEMAKRIISSLDLNYIINYILSLSKKLYLSNPYVVAYALISLGMISTISPEHLTNTLPEIIMLSDNHDNILIQVLAIEVLGEFKNLEKEHAIFLFFQLYSMHRENNLIDDGGKYRDTQLSIARNENLSYLVYMCLKKDATTEEIRQVVKGVNHHTIYGIILGFLGLYTHFKTLKDLMYQEHTLFKGLLNEIMNNIEKDNFIIKISAMLLFSKLLIYVENENNYLKEHITEDHIGIFFNEIYNNLNSGDYLIKGYSLEVLYRVFKNIDSEYYREKIKDIVDSIDLESIMNEGYLSYYYGIYLAYYFGRHEDLSAKYSPNMDRALIKEFKELGLSKFQELIKNINLDIKKRRYLDRFYAGKYLGNMLYARIGYNSNMFEVINTMLHDNNYLNRNIGVWLFRLIIELEDKPPNNFNLIIKSSYLFDDWYFGNRIEYLLLYTTLINKYSKNLELKRVKMDLISIVLTKHLTDKSKFIRDVSKEILYNLTNDPLKYHEFLDYNNRTFEEQIYLIGKYIKFPETRKASIILIKNKLEYCLKKNEYSEVNKLLKILYDNIYEETIYVILELIKLKKKNIPLSKDIIKLYLKKYPKLPWKMGDTLYRFIMEPIFKIRVVHLYELLKYVEEGIKIQNKLLNRVKELVIYADIYDRDVNIAMKILSKINDPESSAILEEKNRAINNEVSNHLLNTYVVNTSNNEKPNYIKITYIPTLDTIEVQHENSNIVQAVIEILHIKKAIVPKIMILDFLIDDLLNDEDILNSIISTNIFEILSKLATLSGYGLINRRSLNVLEKISLNKSNWLKNNLLDNFDKKTTPLLIIKLLRYNLSPYVELEVIETWEHLLKNNLIIYNCKMVGTLYRVIENTSSDQPWTLYKKISNIIRLCPELKENEELLNILSKKIMDHIQWTTSDTAKVCLTHILEEFNTKEDANKDHNKIH